MPLTMYRYMNFMRAEGARTKWNPKSIRKGGRKKGPGRDTKKEPKGGQGGPKGSKKEPKMEPKGGPKYKKNGFKTLFPNSS